jgi:hypothetical protein
MGADPNGKVARLFNVYVPDAGLALRGVPPRPTVVATPQGPRAEPRPPLSAHPRRRWKQRSDREESQMAETMTTGLKLGQRVPDFELTTYEPAKGDFGKFSLKDQIANKRWTILFFYPADFTFV